LNKQISHKRNFREENLMKITTRQTDNVVEILSKVLEFTDRRAKVLHNNIVNVNTENYRPADLDATTFADLMGQALSSHLISERLILIDSEYIKFGADGTFEAIPFTDTQASELLVTDTKQYLKHQMKKISENLMNKKVAAQLIEQKHSQKTYLNK
jgi:flagellar basal body rod protein FlgB